MMPTPSTPTPGAEGAAGVERSSWMQRASRLLFVLLALELGLFLLLYPWMDAWSRNYLVSLSPRWQEFFLSSQFRGALSGLGVLNLYIAASETLTLLLRALRPSG